MFLSAAAAATTTPLQPQGPDRPAPRQAERAARGEPRYPLALAPAEAVRARAAADPAALAGLSACVEDVGAAALRGVDGPPDPTSFTALRTRLQRASTALPPVYRAAVAAPLLRALDHLGAPGFARLLAEDPERQGQARLLLDLAQGVLQRGEGYLARATAAFQEVVSDLYDGFLSAEDRRGVKPPDHGVLPPLVRWGSAETGPYTWPVTATAAFDVSAPLVSLPAANAQGGLLAWAALAHETAGHDLLEADEGLRDELEGAVRAGVRGAGMSPALADYWAERVEETAADVLGVLNMGPASAVGLIGYFRGLHGAWGAGPRLRADGAADDPHPADLARAYLVAETVRLLSFSGASAWADRLTAEADRDLAGRRGVLHLGEVAVTAGVAKASAAAAARAIARTRLASLEGHALGEIQDWRDRDEALVAGLRRALGRGGGRSTEAGPAEEGLAGASAAHVVAAGIYQAVSGGSRPDQVMGPMIGLLAGMNGRSPVWAPPRSAATPGLALISGGTLGTLPPTAGPRPS